MMRGALELASYRNLVDRYQYHVEVYDTIAILYYICSMECLGPCSTWNRIVIVVVLRQE